MASCSAFDIQISGDVAAALTEARRQVLAGGGTWDGGATGGSFGGKVPIFGTIKGKYAVNGQTITITIAEKPLLVPCASIEAQIRQAFRRP